MIKIEHTRVAGFDTAMRAMRNPLDSWEKSDTEVARCAFCDECQYLVGDSCASYGMNYRIGERDAKLSRTLAKNGPDHAKHLRMVAVWADVTAPLYWWKQLDTYKVGVVTCSCSTMHKLGARPLTEDDFSGPLADCFPVILVNINAELESFRENGDVDAWERAMRTMPNGYLQRRTLTANYQALCKMWDERRAHKLSEWHEFCSWAEGLPYFRELTGRGL